MGKIAIFYASFGQGHKKGAEALKYLPDASVYDLLNFTNPLLRKVYSLSYLLVTQHFPFLWKVLFFLAKVRFFSYCLDKINCWMFSSFFRYLRDAAPKIIIVTHFFPSRLISSIKDKVNFRVISIITDIRVHPLWVAGCVDHYFTALETGRQDLIKLGVEEKKVTTGFVPLRKGFLEDIPWDSLGEKFRLSQRPSIIFASSSRGKFPYLEKTIKLLLKKFNIFIIYGANSKLKLHLERLNSPYLRLFSFYDKIWELVSVSSIIISKPGGMTIFEGIYKRKLFIFTHYIPGQEEGNMKALIDKGIAKFARSPKQLVEAVDNFNRNADALINSYPLEVKNIKQPLLKLVGEWINA